jgi:hypothetical protein
MCRGGRLRPPREQRERATAEVLPQCRIAFRSFESPLDPNPIQRVASVTVNQLRPGGSS